MANAVPVSHPLKEIFKANKVALGLLTRLARSGDIARIAKTTGHDFVFMDAQHAAYNIETIAQIAQTALGIGIPPLVRVRSCDDPQTQVLLDVGATGIVFPDVNTAAEAKRAVDRARFPPVGKRSVAGAYPIFDYRPMSMPDTVAALTENTLVVCMIETPEGLENVEAIAAVEGVDVIHVGLNDLLTAMGKPGSYGSPEHIAALDRVFAAAKKHGKVAGVGGDRNVQRQMDSIRKGAQFLTTNSDIAFMMAEATRVTGDLRKAIAE
ncbi:MAG TPA: aldolase/citrate lyase family protein [Burkholderiales bacterium]|jgi:2-keto-3-deoxy-L-rhamnonate aldolase RhmA|nr:aldolase/citrate lyase family protein [Burkholderiales bacterium]